MQKDKLVSFGRAALFYPPMTESDVETFGFRQKYWRHKIKNAMWMLKYPESVCSAKTFVIIGTVSSANENVWSWRRANVTNGDDSYPANLFYYAERRYSSTCFRNTTSILDCRIILSMLMSFLTCWSPSLQSKNNEILSNLMYGTSNFLTCLQLTMFILRKSLHRRCCAA